MALVVVNNGESIALSYLTNKVATPENLVVNLYKSNTTPAENDTTATYTASTFTGYAAQTLTGATWGAPVTGNPTSITYGAQLTFTCSGASSENVYGYFITRLGTGDLVWAERDAAAPFPIANSGDAVKITPTITAE